MSRYRPCACRDCFEIAIGDDGHPGGVMCHECQEAGCTPCTCSEEDDRPCEAYNEREHRHEECQAPGAYGADEEEEEDDR